MIDYQELIKAELFEKEWVPQDSVLSAVARKRHGISRSGDKKKGAVLIALKAMLRKGLLKKAVDEDGNVFWGKRLPGEEPIEFRKKTKIQFDVEELSKLSTARKNIALLEDVLMDIFSEVFENTYGQNWEKYIDQTTHEKLKIQYRKAEQKDWVVGGSPRELLSAAGIKDFSYMLGNKNNRELFKKIFQNTFIAAAKLTELGEYRNRIQHNEKLSKDEITYFNIATGLLLRDLDRT